jgi:hypothetical protein
MNRCSFYFATIMLLIAISEINAFTPKSAIVKRKDSRIFTNPRNILNNYFCDISGVAGANEDGNALADSEKVNQLPAKKDPGLAFAIAFAPGFFIHGLGNYYAGDNSAGSKLLAAELASVFVGYIAVLKGMGGMDESRNKTAESIIGITTAWVFLGSWVIDMGTAPRKVAKANRNNAGAIIYPVIKGKQLAIQISFSLK